MMVSRRLFQLALVLGAAAPFAGSPFRPPASRMDVDALARAIEDGSDHVSARELALWIRNRRPGLRIIDIRTSAQFAEDAIPTAQNMPIGTLLQTRFAPGETVVLYSQEGAHAGQAWVLLRMSDLADVVFIPGGFADWQDEVMYPLLASDLTPDQHDEIVGISHYFGGSPRLAGPGETVAVLAAERPRTRRRGC